MSALAPLGLAKVGAGIGAELDNTFMIGLCSQFYEARLIRTLVLVEISLGRVEFSGFDGQL